MSAITIQQALQAGLQHHQAGRLADAEAIYRQILAAEACNADALHLLGLIAHRVGRGDAAVELIRQAIAADSSVPAYHNNLGNILRDMGRAGDAVAVYRRAVELRPDYAEGHASLGNALKDLGLPDEAMAAYRRALELRPDSAEIHNNLGNTLNEQGRFAEAVAAYRSALSLKPDYAEARGNLGITLHAAGQLGEADAACREALRLQPASPAAHFNLGNICKDAGRFDEAAACYRQAIALHPDFAEAQSNLGSVLKLQGRPHEAVVAYQRAIVCNLDTAEVRSNLGNALRETGRMDEAVAALRGAIQLKPGYAEVHGYLGNALETQGRIGEAIAAYRHSLELKSDFPEARGSLVFCMHYLPDAGWGSLLGEHCRWDEVHARPLAAFIQPHANAREPERTLRVGYVSPDFREHSVAFFLEGLLASHDPARVEVFCYSNLAWPDHVTERLRRLVPHWRDVFRMPDEEVAGLVRNDGIDILVDLAGHTAGNRLLLFARKPAPVQAAWLGYPDTTGMKVMDWRLTDARADPPGATEQFYTEQLFRLADSAWCYRPPREAPPVGALPCAQTGGVTFGCFNTLPKINAPLLELWSQILDGSPGARLLIKNLALRDASARERMRGVLEEAGIAPERIELAGHVPGLAGHLAAYGRVDIALDTFPYHGTTTTCEALWMGVPVVALAGKTHCSRVGVSLLTSAGLPELIAATPAQYVQIACDLAADPSRIAGLRAGLRGRIAASPLMDGPRFARNVEQAYREMWRAWCARAGP